VSYDLSINLCFENFFYKHIPSKNLSALLTWYERGALCDNGEEEREKQVIK